MFYSVGIVSSCTILLIILVYSKKKNTFFTALSKLYIQNRAVGLLVRFTSCFGAWLPFEFLRAFLISCIAILFCLDITFSASTSLYSTVVIHFCQLLKNNSILQSTRGYSFPLRKATQIYFLTIIIQTILSDLWKQNNVLYDIAFSRTEADYRNLETENISFGIFKKKIGLKENSL